jgi:ABC-type multidrug transport system fused ATPase/permease subunit
MEEAFQDKTVIVIAHRFTSIRGVDMVYCMEDGRIVEHGQTCELMARDSHLQRMAIAQGYVDV